MPAYDAPLDPEDEDLIVENALLRSHGLLADDWRPPVADPREDLTDFAAGDWS